LAGLGSLALAGPAQAICGLYPAAENWLFLADVEDMPVGEHRIAFSRSGGQLLVRSETAVDNGRGWQLNRSVAERWQDGWLHAITAETQDQLGRYALTAERQPFPAHRPDLGVNLVGTAGQLTFAVAGYVVPTTFWHRDTPRTQVLFSVVDGLTKVVAAAKGPRETILLGARSVKAQSWRLSGEWNCYLWYDDSCALVQFSIPGPAGRPLRFRRAAEA